MSTNSESPSLRVPSYDNPSDYRIPTEAPPLIGDGDTNVVVHNLFDSSAPEHSRNYINGLDVIEWDNADGNRRSQFVLDQKSAAMTLPFEKAAAGNSGAWIYLAESYRGPHSKDERRVKDVIARGALGSLGVWGLEAPSGGLMYDKNGVPVESPVQAAVREMREETGLQFDETDLISLIPGGIKAMADVSTREQYPFAVDVQKGIYNPKSAIREDDEITNGLMAFHVRDRADLLRMMEHSRVSLPTIAAMGAAALHPRALGQII